MEFTKQKALEMWRPGDGAAIAAAVGISRQAVHYWKKSGKGKSEHEDAILAACAKRFMFRRRVPGFVVVDAATV